MAVNEGGSGRVFPGLTNVSPPSRVLIVDDHDLMRKAIKHLVCSDGRFVVCGEAANGLEAIQKVQDLKPSAIVMDITMPVMGGLEATNHIRRLFPQIKIIIVTVHDSKQVRDLAVRSGADAMITKPEISVHLLQTLQKLLYSPHPLNQELPGPKVPPPDAQS